MQYNVNFMQTTWLVVTALAAVGSWCSTGAIGAESDVEGPESPAPLITVADGFTLEKIAGPTRSWSGKSSIC